MSEATATVQMSTDRRFVMIGNWVRILVGYNEGVLARIVGPDFGSGKVTLNVGTFEQPRYACYTTREIAPVTNPGERRVDMPERMLLVERRIALNVEGKCNRRISEATRKACLRRAEKLDEQIQHLDRVWKSGLDLKGPWGTADLPNYCNALVLYSGGQH